MKRETLARLRAITGDAGIVSERTDRLAYESDGLGLIQRTPDLVLLPRDTEQVAAAMRVLHEAGIPIVPRGAGSRESLTSKSDSEASG